MAKAQFHKNQRVYVKPVGTWALIEHVVPHWAKGLDEPIRVHYDVGLGREFAAEELQSEEPVGEMPTQQRPALARGAGPQQMAAGGRLRPPSSAGHLSCGDHRRGGMGRLARAGRGI